MAGGDRGFKMKGYSYPGVSPLREGEKVDTKKVDVDVEETEAEFLARMKKEGVPISPEVTIKGKKKAKIDWGEIATNALSSVAQIGAQAGIEALVNPRERVPRATTPAGMGGVQYGSGTNLLAPKKQT